MKNMILISALAIAISACQSLPYQPYARDVKKKPNTNGIIALKLDHREEDRAKAQTMMSSNCLNSNVKILEEGEVVIGQESSTDSKTSKSAGTSSSQVGSLFGLPVMSGGQDPTDTTNSRVSTTQVKEWQINYECISKKSTTR